MPSRIDNEFQELKESVHSWLVQRLDEEGIEVGKTTKPTLAEFIRRMVPEYIAVKKVPLSAQDLSLLKREMIDEVVGFGPLEPLLSDPSIDDILVNGPTNIFVEISGLLQKANVRFINDEHVIRIIRRILSPLGRRLDESSPMVDARLPDGSRINAIIPPVAIDGPSLSIRKFSKKHLSSNDLILGGALTLSGLKTLSELVVKRRNILVSGGTGTGKTTILNLLSQYIPRNERIVTIEDSAELSLNHRHVVRLETRPNNTEGAGAVSARDLAINSLRMRPDRIILGEVRSGEVIELLQAMNTGHEGSMSTIHSNSAQDALVRIETLLAINGYDASEKAISRLISSSIDVIVQLSRNSHGRRYIHEIVELKPTPENFYNMNQLYKGKPDGQLKLV